MYRSLPLVALSVILVCGFGPASGQEVPKKDKADPAPNPPTIKAKPTSQAERNALDFLIKQQANGAWDGGPGAALFERALGGGFDEFGRVKPPMKGGGDPTVDVANTSIALLALLRGGYSPKQGAHADVVRKGINTVLKAVETADKASLALSGKSGTQVQRKIGDYADTYLAAIMLATARGKMPDAAGEARVEKALQKIVDKMEANQKADGTWNGEGWAPVLSQALASRAINMAKQVGIAVERKVLDRTATQAKETFKQIAEGRGRGVIGGNAGVDLYSAAAAISALQDAVNTHQVLGGRSRTVLRSINAKVEDRKEAEEQLEKLDEWEKALREALKIMVKKVQDPNFVKGFGTDGGEEFISFWLIAEALKMNELKEFADWDKAMTERLTKAQNGNGSWSGKHCISGETFCTATSLLTLMADRAKKPDEAMLFSTVARSPDVPNTTTTATPVTDGTEKPRPDLGKVEGAPKLSESEQLYRALVNAPETREAHLEKLRDGKGAEYTDALTCAAAKLTGEAQKDTRVALAQRLTRMTAKTLRSFLQDPDTELRLAATRACALKQEKQHVPELIALLNDSEMMIATAAQQSLKTLSGKDFGPEPDASAAERTKAIVAWRQWWAGQPK